MEPDLNGFDFDVSYLYQPTFSLRLCTADSKGDKSGYMMSSPTDVTYHGTFTAKDDASILRGVETYSFSSCMFHKIKKHMLDPSSASTVTGISDRFNVLKGMITGKQCNPRIRGNSAIKLDESIWDLPGGQHGTWLAADEPKGAAVRQISDKHKSTVSSLTKRIEQVQSVDVPSDTQNSRQSRFGRKIQRKNYMDCIEYS